MCYQKTKYDWLMIGMAGLIAVLMLLLAVLVTGCTWHVANTHERFYYPTGELMSTKDYGIGQLRWFTFDSKDGVTGTVGNIQFDINKSQSKPDKEAIKAIVEGMTETLMERWRAVK